MKSITILLAAVGEACETNLQDLESRGGIDGEVVSGRLGLLHGFAGRVPGNSSHFQVICNIIRQRNCLENGRQAVPKIEAVYIHGWSKMGQRREAARPRRCGSSSVEDGQGEK